MEVTYIDHMGSDLSVVNAARVSFAKQHEEFQEHKDVRLIQFLARHNHWTPFGHATVTLHIKAPIFIARQLAKHQTGLVWNEVSRRYVDDEPELFTPEAWRKRPEGSVKQGSSEETIPMGWEVFPLVLTAVEMVDYDSDQTEVCIDYEEVRRVCLGQYKKLIELGVAPEQARMVLPQSMYTEWYWTGSLAAWARVYSLRSESTAQKEVQEVAKLISATITPLYPVSWAALTQKAVVS